MPVIKRYPNRKLYDTEGKRYITLDGIAELIRQRQDVRVLDHATGEDLTALTLSQIIFEQEKKHAGFLPHPVLTGLIRAGGDTLSTLRRTLAVSLGFLQHVDEEIQQRVERLVSQGELTPDESRKLLLKLLPRQLRSHDGSWREEQDLEQLLAAQGVPTREDLQRVSEQLNQLAAKIDALSQDDDRS